MSTPNLFNYATSELSQDAFILWLLDWANPQYREADECLHAAAQEFVRLLVGVDEDITSVKCKKQMYHIDVFAIVNEKYALIIEDKTDTKEHGEQMKRYSELVLNDIKYSKYELRCTYYKSGNESITNLKKLSIDCNQVFRKQVLEKLFPYVEKTQNPIFVDYMNHINEIENLTSSYLTEVVDNWADEAWEGFYMELEKGLEMGNWGVDYYHKDFMLPKISIGDGLSLYLYLDKSRNLCIKAKCKSKRQPEDGWRAIIKILKSVMLSHPELDGLKFDGKPNNGSGNVKDIKLLEIKRVVNNESKLFIRKKLSFATQPFLIPQLKLLQRQLEIAVKEIQKYSEKK